jgi:hypothetical protein
MILQIREKVIVTGIKSNYSIFTFPEGKGRKRGDNCRYLEEFHKVIQ